MGHFQACMINYFACHKYEKKRTVQNYQEKETVSI